MHLLTYDLSQGLARQMSLGLLGFQLDAVYHTSILLNGREYVYDGGVVDITPGTSHLGQPLQQIPLGRTELPMDVILEYLQSLRQIYTLEAYNLWHHNCNNFSNDFSTFLVGKGIPDHILHMPDAVINSPLGAMLMPALNQSVAANRQGGGILGIEASAQGSRNGALPPAQKAQDQVRHVTNLADLESLLASAQKSCAVVFFTSAGCQPCRMLYPLYDELAAEAGDKGTLIKVDISVARDVASKYEIRATPTFITFLHGEQERRWTGSQPSELRGNVQLLLQMAHPLHPHQKLNLPTFSRPDPKPVLYTKVPPLPKLVAKMGPAANDSAIKGVIDFIETRSTKGPAEAPLPDIARFTTYLQTSFQNLPPEVMFTVLDLLRSSLVDPRFSGFLAEEADHRTIVSVLTYVNSLTDCPYSLRLVTLQTVCNLFSTQLYPAQVLEYEQLRSPVIHLISSSFLDDSHNSVRVAAASLLFNVSIANSTKRREGADALPEGDQVELAASVLEAISQEEKSPEALEGMLQALGYLCYCMPLDGELADTMRAMDAQDTIGAKQKSFEGLGLVREVGEVLLGKGLRKP